MVNSLFKAFTLLGSEWVMWILLLLSILSVAVMIERFRNLRNQERLGAKLWETHVGKWLSSDDSSIKLDAAKGTELNKTYPCVEGKLIEVLSTKKGQSRSDLELTVSSFLGSEKLRLEKNLIFLGTVGSNAPFIGLFGTVLGIIKAFDDIANQSSVDLGGAQGISYGISEALVATAVGLLVAIPAVIAFNYFQRKIKTIVGRASSLADTLIKLQSKA